MKKHIGLLEFGDGVEPGKSASVSPSYRSTPPTTLMLDQWTGTQPFPLGPLHSNRGPACCKPPGKFCSKRRASANESVSCLLEDRPHRRVSSSWFTTAALEQADFSPPSDSKYYWYRGVCATPREIIELWFRIDFRFWHSGNLQKMVYSIWEMGNGNREPPTFLRPGLQCIMDKLSCRWNVALSYATNSPNLLRFKSNQNSSTQRIWSSGSIFRNEIINCTSYRVYTNVWFSSNLSSFNCRCESKQTDVGACLPSASKWGPSFKSQLPSHWSASLVF